MLESINITSEVKKLLKFLLFITMFLILTGFLSGMIQIESGDSLKNNRILFRFVELFNLNLEANIPAWYSAFLMIIVSILCYLAGKVSESKLRKYYFVLAAGFILMSLDEISSVHEILNNPVRNALGLKGILYWSWIVPGILLVITVLIYFKNFFNLIDKKFRRLYLLSGTIYLMGAIVLEMIGGWLYSHNLGNTVFYVSEVVIEEGMEMSGLLLFIYSLNEYLISLSNKVKSETKNDITLNPNNSLNIEHSTFNITH
jgi:hypothetical protein